MSKRAGESIATSASAKQKRVHCSGLIARQISDKNADMDCHAVPPPNNLKLEATPNVKTCQQDSERVHKATPAASSFGQLYTLGASSSGRPVVTEELSRGKVVHLRPNTDGEKYVKKFNGPAKNFKPQSEEEHEFYNQISNSICAKIGLRSFSSSMGFILAHKGSRRLTEGWR